VRVQGAWNKTAVVAREDDGETMLNHTLLPRWGINVFLPQERGCLASNRE